EWIVGSRPLNENARDLVIAAFDAPKNVGSRHREHEIRIRRRGDHSVQGLGIFRFYLAPIAIFPPIIHSRPALLADVEDIIAENRHALIEASLDAGDGGAH